MTNLTRARPSSTALLARILDTPDLEAHVQALAPTVFARLIDRVGLEDAGELVAFATTEQIAQVWDEDLWQSDRPGEDERFDAGRFLVWLSIMREAGDAFVAQKLADLPQDLVTLAFHKHLLVIRLEDLLAEMREAGEDARATEKALSNCLYEEIDEYQIIARSVDGWDDVLAAVLALDRDHRDVLEGILDRCAAMDAECIEDAGGLYEVLTSEETLEADVAGDREDRRAEAGHVAPSAAASFLKLARATRDLPREQDAVTRAYFREVRPGTAPREASAVAPRLDFVQILRDAEVVDATAPLLPAKAEREERALVRALRVLAEEDPACFFARSDEIAYLANVLAAGCSIGKGEAERRLRPVEALRAAIAACDIGLALTAKDDGTRAIAILRAHSADALFRVAWGRLQALGRGAEARFFATLDDPEKARALLASLEAHAH